MYGYHSLKYYNWFTATIDLHSNGKPLADQNYDTVNDVSYQAIYFIDDNDYRYFYSINNTIVGRMIKDDDGKKHSYYKAFDMIAFNPMFITTGKNRFNIDNGNIQVQIKDVKLLSDKQKDYICKGKDLILTNGKNFCLDYVQFMHYNYVWAKTRHNSIYLYVYM